MKVISLSVLLMMPLVGATVAAEAPQMVTAERPTGSAEQKGAAPAAAPSGQKKAAPAAAPQATRHGFGHKVLLYIPNRIFDVLDVVRARVRIGPGFSVAARVTKYTDVFLGAYKSFYIGLPGPRQIPRVPWPGGIESRSGLAASVADDTVTSYDSNPRYSVTEAGVGVQAILVGAEAGVDVAEVFDLALGLLFIDFREDDL
jgi:hypothetical protein